MEPKARKRGAKVIALSRAASSRRDRARQEPTPTEEGMAALSRLLEPAAYILPRRSA
ncbi:MAG: hypothetical protein JST54_18785 [Deltaproteobacteria bacterium]|nr:hypothetical protein [Deltaproteobacteria bacterium]